MQEQGAQAPSEQIANSTVVDTTVVDGGHFFEVKLENFDGPIDLLLHLVKRQELPIEKLSLYQVTAQYFECLDRMKHLDLEVAGEYLVIAATLLSIKASIVLNEPVELVPDDEGRMVDPHQELLDRLREAAVFKDGAMMLNDRPILGLDVFENRAPIDGVTPPGVRYKEHDPMLLAKAFRKMIAKAEQAGRPLLSFMVDSVSIVERMMGILDILGKAHGPVSFERLISDPTDKGSIISGFLALLELAKRGAIGVRQDENFDDIVIVLSDLSIEAAPGELVSEFDEEDDKVTVNE